MSETPGDLSEGGDHHTSQGELQEVILSALVEDSSGLAIRLGVFLSDKFSLRALGDNQVVGECIQARNTGGQEHYETSSFPGEGSRGGERQGAQGRRGLGAAAAAGVGMSV